MWADIRELLRWPLQKFPDSATPCESASRLSRFALLSDTLDPPQSSGRPIVLPPQHVWYCGPVKAKAACAPANPKFALHSEKHSSPFRIRQAIADNSRLFADRVPLIRLESAPLIAVALCASIAKSHQRSAPEWHLTV